MKKPPQNSQSELVTVFVPTRMEGHYGYYSFEIPKEILDKHGKLIKKSEPDILALTLNAIDSDIMDVFGL